ncbi:MAG: DUF2135 domain-containing protein [Elusimicrobiota bacterium]
MLVSASSAAWGEAIKVDAPPGGWRHSKGEKIKFSQKVNYPASDVSSQAGQSRAGRIEGRIKSAIKDHEKPYTLIVNGIPMPLKVRDGRFSRPYSFGPGSNSVEIRSPDGKERARTQFYEAYSGASRPRIRVVLGWDTDGTDLDLHVVTPDGEHCYYANRALDNGGALDVDVTTGYGPEIFAAPAPIRGTYLVYVNFYGSGRGEDLTVARVTIITHENTGDEKSETKLIPMRSSGELTLAATFVYP